MRKKINLLKLPTSDESDQQNSPSLKLSSVKSKNLSGRESTQDQIFFTSRFQISPKIIPNSLTNVSTGSQTERDYILQSKSITQECPSSTKRTGDVFQYLQYCNNQNIDKIRFKQEQDQQEKKDKMKHFKRQSNIRQLKVKINQLDFKSIDKIADKWLKIIPNTTRDRDILTIDLATQEFKALKAFPRLEEKLPKKIIWTDLMWSQNSKMNNDIVYGKDLIQKLITKKDIQNGNNSSVIKRRSDSNLFNTKQEQTQRVKLFKRASFMMLDQLNGKFQKIGSEN